MRQRKSLLLGNKVINDTSVFIIIYGFTHVFTGHLFYGAWCGHWLLSQSRWETCHQVPIRACIALYFPPASFLLAGFKLVWN